MNIDFPGIGERLRAYRIGAAMTAEQIADELEISRAAVYRMEKGEIVKVETLQRLATLLDVSLASLLGVEMEYYSNALSYFERMRQLEQGSVRILSYFQPVSFLLTSQGYADRLKRMLIEAVPDNVAKKQQQKTIEKIIEILAERKARYDRRRQPIISLIGLRELERFMTTGLIGKMDLPYLIKNERRAAARDEVAHIAHILEEEPIGIQIGIVDDNMPGASFQIFQGLERSFVSTSPFRLGELPNIRTGIATVTSSSDAVKMYENMFEQLWQGSYKGTNGAKAIRALLARFSTSLQEQKSGLQSIVK